MCRAAFWTKPASHCSTQAAVFVATNSDEVPTAAITDPVELASWAFSFVLVVMEYSYRAWLSLVLKLQGKVSSEDTALAGGQIGSMKTTEARRILETALGTSVDC